MKKVIVGLSGGVDSSVAALLLKEQGHQVQGVFMNNWHEPETGAHHPHCTAPQDLKDAQSACEQLNIPFTTIDFSQAYWDNVFEAFLSAYAAGLTPNPDILCNQEIKFKAFLDYALAQNADFIATGHYVILQKDDPNTYTPSIPHFGKGHKGQAAQLTKINEPRKSQNFLEPEPARQGTYQLCKGHDVNKDQSYFLYTLNQHQLAHSLFPVGHLKKAQVRAIAKAAGLVTHDKKDSMGICFIGKRKFKTFLSEYLLNKPGAIQTSEGEVIGQHQGLMFYTIGQRQGLDIGGKQGRAEKPWYVADKLLKTNRLVVVQGHDHPLLYKKSLYCRQLHWISGFAPYSAGSEKKNIFQASAKIRYRQSEQPCWVQPVSSESGVYQVTFESPQWAVTPGQSIVFYQGNICLGGGIIHG